VEHLISLGKEEDHSVNALVVEANIEYLNKKEAANGSRPRADSPRLLVASCVRLHVVCAIHLAWERCRRLVDCSSLLVFRKDPSPMSIPQTSNGSRFENAFALSAQDALNQLGGNRQDGLSHEEADRRLETYGWNQLRGKKAPSLFVTMVRQLRSFLILILMAAVIISVWVGNWIEAFVILAIILLNALVGALQERKAERALQSLKELAAPDARVLRDGTTQLIPARDLVPGDLVFSDRRISPTNQER